MLALTTLCAVSFSVGQSAVPVLPDVDQRCKQLGRARCQLHRGYFDIRRVRTQRESREHCHLDRRHAEEGDRPIVADLHHVPSSNVLMYGADTRTVTTPQSDDKAGVNALY
jgi:hypothetical protein